MSSERVDDLAPLVHLVGGPLDGRPYSPPMTPELRKKLKEASNNDPTLQLRRASIPLTKRPGWCAVYTVCFDEDRVVRGYFEKYERSPAR